MLIMLCVQHENKREERIEHITLERAGSKIHIVDLESAKVASYLEFIELLNVTEVYQENSLQYVEIEIKIVDGVRVCLLEDSILKSGKE